ncbi:hypothetical protein BST61_g3548 [Cercospora zeina]
MHRLCTQAQLKRKFWGVSPVVWSTRYLDLVGVQFGRNLRLLAGNGGDNTKGMGVQRQALVVPTRQHQHRQRATLNTPYAGAKLPRRQHISGDQVDSFHTRRSDE